LIGSKIESAFNNIKIFWPVGIKLSGNTWVVWLEWFVNPNDKLIYSFILDCYSFIGIDWHAFFCFKYKSLAFPDP